MYTRIFLLASLCAVALSDAAATPAAIRDSLITLPLARRVNVTSVQDLLKHDRARAKVLKARSQGRADGVRPNHATIFDLDATNTGVTYTASVGVGTPPRFYDLIVDTGSANTWVGAGGKRPFLPTSSSVLTGQLVSVTYGSGSFTGMQVKDTVSLGGLAIKGQGVGVAIVSTGFNGVDGILGIGPVDLTKGTVVVNIGEPAQVPTVLDNAFGQGLIGAELIGVSFEPTTQLDVKNGVLTLGGVDSSKFTGSITFVPITATLPASEFVGIDQSITYGSTRTPILDPTAGITDTGTTLTLIASDAFAKYKNATGGVLDNNGLLRITPDQFANLESLFFHIGDRTFELTPNAQIWPRSLNTVIGGVDGAIYLIVADLGSNSGEGLDFINGFTFLERFYHVFDVTNSQVGFATTPFTDATTN